MDTQAAKVFLQPESSQQQGSTTMKIIHFLLTLLFCTGCSSHHIEKTTQGQDTMHSAATASYFLQSSRLHAGQLQLTTGMAMVAYSADEGCFLMTNKHLVHNADAILVKSWRGSPGSQEEDATEQKNPGHQATVVFESRNSDFALIRINRISSCKPREIASADPETGESLTVFGQPLSKTGAMTRGIVSGYWNIHNQGLLMVSDILTVPGFSGSAAFLQDQTVAGLVTGKTKVPSIGFAYIIPATRLRILLNQALAFHKNQTEKKKQKTTRHEEKND